MKKLKKYLAEERGRQARLAKTLDIPPSTIVRLASGQVKNPGILLVLAIEKATEGRIKPHDWA